MPTRRTVSISLSPEMQAVAGRLRDTGRYGNISDVMRAALRLLKERELDFRTYRNARLVATAHLAATDRDAAPA